MRTLARWARTFGLTRTICVLLLLALIPLRIVDPPPLEEIQLQVSHPPNSSPVAGGFSFQSNDTPGAGAQVSGH
jgi:hypothetical protein